MRGADASAHSLPPGAATNSRMSRIRPQAPTLRSSPAHPWRAPVRQTLRSHRSGQRWSLVAVVAVALSCLVLSQLRRAGCDRLPRPSDRVLPAGALRATSAKRSPRGPEVERGGGDCSPRAMNPSYARLQQGRDVRDVRMSKRCSQCRDVRRSRCSRVKAMFASRCWRCSLVKAMLARDVPQSQCSVCQDCQLRLCLVPISSCGKMRA